MLRPILLGLLIGGSLGLTYMVGGIALVVFVIAAALALASALQGRRAA
jgi:hypothetical protein